MVGTRIKDYISQPIFTYQFFQSSRTIATLAVSIILVQAGLQADQVGLWEWIFYVGSLFTFFWTSAIYQNILYAPQNKIELSWSSGLTKIALLGAFLLIVAWLLWYCKVVNGFSVTYVDYFVWLYGSLLLFGYVHYLYRLHKNGQVRWISIIYLFSFLGIFSLYFWPDISDVITVVLRYAGLFLVIYVFGKNFRLIQLSRLKWTHSEVQLILYILIGSAPLYFDSWLVKWWYKANEEFAIYRLGARELPLIIPLLISYGQAWVPKIRASIYPSGQTLQRITLWVGGLVIVFLMSSTFLYDWIYKGQYKESVILFDLSLFLIFSKLIFSQTELYARENYKTVTNIGWIELIVNVLLSILFLYFWGMKGIVMATVVAYFLEKILQLRYLNKAGFDINKIMSQKTLLSVITISTVVLIVKYYLFF